MPSPIGRPHHEHRPGPFQPRSLLDTAGWRQHHGAARRSVSAVDRDDAHYPDGPDVLGEDQRGGRADLEAASPGEGPHHRDLTRGRRCPAGDKPVGAERRVGHPRPQQRRGAAAAGHHLVVGADKVGRDRGVAGHRGHTRHGGDLSGDVRAETAVAGTGLGRRAGRVGAGDDRAGCADDHGGACVLAGPDAGDHRPCLLAEQRRPGDQSDRERDRGERRQQPAPLLGGGTACDQPHRSALQAPDAGEDRAG